MRRTAQDAGRLSRKASDRAVRRAAFVLTSLLVGFGSFIPFAKAHPLAPSVLSFEESNTGQVRMTWRTPAARPQGTALRPVVPEGCEILGPPREVRSIDAITETTDLRCSPSGLAGRTLAVKGLGDSPVNVVIRFVHASGAIDHAILDSSHPAFEVPSHGESEGSFGSYLRLGIHHLSTGWDHLLFVFGLIVLFGWHRRLIAAVTAFTIGHSLTLALAIGGVIHAPQRVVEALIAFTIVALALEIQGGSRGLVWRHPWLLPMSLGLLHGLGFASVLSGAGIPEGQVPWALLAFNLGLEVGQLAMIGCAFVLDRVIRGLFSGGLLGYRTATAYLIGSLAAYWCIERTLLSVGYVF